MSCVIAEVTITKIVGFHNQAAASLVHILNGKDKKGFLIRKLFRISPRRNCTRNSYLKLEILSGRYSRPNPFSDSQVHLHIITIQQTNAQHRECSSVLTTFFLCSFNTVPLLMPTTISQILKSLLISPSNTWRSILFVSFASTHSTLNRTKI